MNILFADRKENENQSKRKRIRSQIQKQKDLKYAEHVVKLEPNETKCAKIFTAQIVCPCRMCCHEGIDVAVQKSIFDFYYNLQNWSSKTKFPRSLIETKPVKESLNPKKM